MEAKQVKDLMEAYASVYEKSEEQVIDEDLAGIVDSTLKKTGEVLRKVPGVAAALTVKGGRKTPTKESGGYRSVKEENEKEDENGGASEKSETKFHLKLDKLVHGTFGPSPEEKKMKKEEVETDLFDVILEYLVAEGYADTNKAALAIMANMSEDWKQSIVEQSAIAARAAKVVDDQRQGYHGDSDAINKLTNDLSKSMGRLKRGQGPVVTPGLPGV